MNATHPRSVAVATGLLTLMCSSAILLPSCASYETNSKKNDRLALESFHGNKAQLAIQQAQQAYRVSDLNTARGNAEAAIALVDDNADFHVLYGRILCEQHALEKGMEAFKRAIEIDPKNSSAHYYQGVVFQRWSNDTRAAAAYKAAFDLVPSDLYYFCAYVETLLGMRDFETAHQVIEESLVYFEHNASAHRLRGHLALLESKPADAADHFYQAMLVAPDDAALVDDLIIALYDSGQFVRCRHYIDQLLEKEDTSDRVDLLHLKARCLIETDMLVEARMVYLQALKMNPDSQPMWYEMGMLCQRLGDWRRVEDAARQHVTKWPNRYEGYLLRGLLNEYKEKDEAAAADFARATSLTDNPTDPAILLGLTYRRLGRFQEADAAFQIALEAEGQDPELETLLAGFDDSGDTVGRW
ncbi:MAG: tetratricopeptide repeat protein [Planctomycetota bacterium]